ncbi:MAG: lamin tail domain-containing protein, partial [Candidatus Cloacimonetes bacterium]|nr:lamin tail domain-containing protein [Candidatus Cloacimonadota bacterium]
SSLAMLADKTSGIGTLSFQYRRYGTDAQVDWKVEYSTDAGLNWTQLGSDFTAPATDDVQTFSQAVNISGNVRVRIKRATETGTANKRLNIDDISLTDYAGGSTPTINVTGTLEAFSTYTGTPSAAQTYTVGGSNLTANIAIAAVTGFEYSTDGTNYSSTLSLAPTTGTVATTTIYVRLTGAIAGTPSGNIAHTSTGATLVNVAVSGTVTAPTPTITLSPAALNAFSAYVGTPSAPQTYTVAGVYLTANISIAAVSGFEYSTNGTSFSSTLSLTPTSGTVATTTIYVRLTGTTLGDYSGTIVHTSTGATQQDKAVTGSVTAVPAAETFLEENFEYPAASLLTANGWTAHSGGGTNAFFVSNPGLSYTGYLANSGLCAETTGNNGEDVNRLFAAQTEGSIYASLLVNMSSAAVAGDYFFHLGANPLGSDFKGRVFAQRSAADSLLIRFGISRGGKVETAVWTGYTYSLNTTYLLVLKYTIVSGANNDQAVLWINPVIGATEPAYILASTDIAAADAANIGAVVLRQGNAANPTPVAKYDGLRVTSTWQQLWIATPTPVLHVDTVELDPLACIVNTPSDEIRSYTLYGEDTASQIEVTAPTGFQVSTSIDEGWDGSLHLSPAFSDTIYVRMFASVAGNYDDVITHTSGSAVHVYVAVSGECVAPAIVWNITQNLTAFSAQAGTASDNQQYTLSASNATGDIIVSTTAPFELSTTGVSGWNTELTLGYTFNGTIYVRMNATSAGSFTADITHTTDGASPNAISISGNATPAAGFAYDLFYSEYVYGSGNNKAIEIFNGTGATVDLHDYQYENWYNGGSSPSFVTFAVGTMLAHGETYVIANPTSSAAILAIANATSGNVSFNGDDALVLRKISTDAIVDIFGVIGQDPGTQWTADGGYTTLKKTLVRKSSVISGITVNPTISVPAVTTDFVTLATEWDMYDIDTITYLGSHTFGTGGTLATPVVVITQVGTDVVLTWEPITGAATYRVESSSDPYAADIDWTTETDADNTDETCTISASADKKFYRVIALP